MGGVKKRQSIRSQSLGSGGGFAFGFFFLISDIFDYGGSDPRQINACFCKSFEIKRRLGLTKIALYTSE